MNLHEALLHVGATLPLHNKSVSDRLNRAYDIVRMSDSEYSLVKTPGQGGDTWFMTKASGSLFGEDNHYTIDPVTGCSCPDAQERAEGGLCKHRLAVRLIEAMSPSEPAVLPETTTPLATASQTRPKSHAARVPTARVLYSPEHRIPYASLTGSSKKEIMRYPRALDTLYSLLAEQPQTYRQNPKRCMSAALLGVSKSHSISFREKDIDTVATLLAERL